MRPCQKLSYDRAPLRQLLEAAVAAYVNTTHSRYERKIQSNRVFVVVTSILKYFSDYLTSHHVTMVIL